MLLFILLIIGVAIYLIARKSTISKIIGGILILLFGGILLISYYLAKVGMP